MVTNQTSALSEHGSEVRKEQIQPGVVAHAYNPSSGGRDQEDYSLKPALGK
jgi:hypothetical protein